MHNHKEEKGGPWLAVGAAALVVAVIAVAVAGAGVLSASQPQKESVTLPSYLSPVENGARQAASEPSAEIFFAADGSGEEVRVMSVSGSVTATAAPDRAVITLSVETLSDTASESQAQNAETANAVMSALSEAGVPDDAIKTTSYQIYEDFEWNETARKQESRGFRTQNTVVVTLEDVSQTGGVIDAAVRAGANRVQGVQFTLSDDKADELRTQALSDAAKKARAKAQSIASGLGVGIGRVHSASESGGYNPPVFYNRSFAEDSAMAAGAPTPVTPGDVELSVTVSVQFEIE